jgi:hypothetical protein
MRRLMVGMTLGIAVGLGIIVTVVGATLAVVDKRASEMLTAPPRKASVPATSPPKVEQASKPTEAPRTTTAQAPAVAAPAATSAAPPPAPAQAAATNPPAPSNPAPAPRPAATQPPIQTAAPNPPPQPAPAQTTASGETKQVETKILAPAAAPADEAKRIVRGNPPRDAKRPDRDTSRAVAKRTRDETDGAAPRDADTPRTDTQRTVTREDDAPRGQLVIRGDDGRYRAVRRGGTRPAEQDEADAPSSDRVVIIQRPGVGAGVARAQPTMRPAAADDGDGPRNGGLFGFIFGRHGDDD